MWCTEHINKYQKFGNCLTNMTMPCQMPLNAPLKKGDFNAVAPFRKAGIGEIFSVSAFLKYCVFCAER